MLAQTTAVSQHKSADIKAGDIYFKNSDYSLAIKSYEKALEDYPKDPYVSYQLAESNRFINNYENAEPNYKTVIDYLKQSGKLNSSNSEYPLIYFRYASTLKANDKCDTALVYFEYFINHFKSNNAEEDKQYRDRALLEYNGCALHAEQKRNLKKDYQFEILPPPINTTFSDYAPTIFINDTVIALTSARKTEKESKVYHTTGEHFSDVMLFKQNVEMWNDVSKDNEFNKINSLLNDGTGSFNAAKDKFYFTKCDINQGGSSGECNIFVSTLSNNKWSKPVALNDNINMAGYWSAQPNLSANSDTLFFVSKRPGGKGNHDIWMSTKSGSGENWGTAINLKNINTAASEISPFYDKKSKTLYFSSNGYEGSGELDIFKTKDSTFTRVQNIGLPFNSPRDDFYFVMGEKYGYLTSNRKNGIGSDDVYRFKTISTEELITVLKPDSTGANQSVSVSGKIVKVSDDSNSSASDLSNGNSNNANNNNKSNNFNGQQTPASNKSVIVKDTIGRIVRKSTTDDNGKFRFESLSAEEKYKVVLGEDGNKNIGDQSEYQVKDLKVVSSKSKPKKVEYEHVFFDFDDFKLRPEATVVLDQLFDIIKSQPQLQIELKAYADNIGSEDYNKKLTALRSDEVFNYLKKRGIDKTALVESYGEEFPMAPNTNPIGRQLNRRLVFGLIGADTIKNTGQVYINSVNQSLADVAKMFGVSKAKLVEMNRLVGDSVAPFKPIRVPSKDNRVISAKTISMANDHQYDKYNKLYDYSGSEALQNKGAITKENGETYYVVQKGNTLFSIAKYFKTQPETIVQLNNLSDYSLKVGQKIKIQDNRE